MMKISFVFLLPFFSIAQITSNSIYLGIDKPFVLKEDNLLRTNPYPIYGHIDLQLTNQQTWGFSIAFQHLLSNKHAILMKTGYQWRKQESKFSFKDNTLYEQKITAFHSNLKFGLLKRVHFFDSVLSLSFGSNLQFRTYKSAFNTELPSDFNYTNDTTLYLVNTSLSADRSSVVLDFEITASVKLSKRISAYTSVEISPRYTIDYSFSKIQYDVSQNEDGTVVNTIKYFPLNNNRYSYSLINLSFGLIYDF